MSKSPLGWLPTCCRADSCRCSSAALVSAACEFCTAARSLALLLARAAFSCLRAPRSSVCASGCSDPAVPLLLTLPAPFRELSDSAKELRTCRLTDASAEELDHQALHPD